MSSDDTDPTSDSSSRIPPDPSFDQLATRLAQLEEWGWVSADEAVDRATKEEVFTRVFPAGQTLLPWDDYHWVRSEFDRRAGEEYDLGQ